MEVRMKKLLIAVALVAVAVAPAYSGPKGDNENMLQKQQDEVHKRESKDVDKAYSDTIKRTRTNDKPYDPWGSVRPTDGTAKK
jgi:Ni/Co efflux regulator RcnB